MYRNQWLEGEVNYLRDNASSKTWREIGEQLGRNRSSIIHKANRLGLRKFRKKDREWSLNEENLLKDKYLTFKWDELNKFFPNRTKTAIQHHAYYKFNMIKGVVPYLYNESFFNPITHNSAYVLGYLFADGCYREHNGKPHYVNLRLKDKEILEKIRDLVCSDKPLYFVESDGCWELAISNNKLLEQLKTYGMEINKTNRMIFPNIGNECLSDFVRGFFDGDGSVWESGGELHISFVGTREFLIPLLTILQDKCLLRGKKKIYKHSSIFRLMFCCRDAQKILNWIYDGSTLHLERKYKKFREIEARLWN